MAESDKITLKHLRMSMEKCKENDNDLQQGINICKDRINGLDSQIKDIENNKSDKSTTENIQQQVNNLVLGAVGDGNNAEVIQARGGYNVLNDRINNIEKLTTNNANYDIYIENLLDINQCKLNKKMGGINSNANNLLDVNNYAVYFLDVIPGEKYIFSNAGYLENMHFINSDGIVIDRKKIPANTSFEIPSNVCKIGYQFTTNSSKDWREFTMLCKGETLPDEFISYKSRKLKKEIKVDLQNLNINIVEKYPIILEDDTVFNELSNGGVVFTIDGMDEETYDAILPYANSLGIPLTLFSGEYTNSLLSKIHNDNYNNYYGIYTSQPKTTFEGTSNYIEQYNQFHKQYESFLKNGLGKPLFASYAGGANTNVTIKVLQEHGIKLARTTATKATITYPISQNMFNTNSSQLSDSNCVEQVRTSLETISPKTVWFITAHSIKSANKTDNYFISESNMKACLDLIKTSMDRGLKAFSFKEFWEYMMFPHDVILGQEVIKKESDNKYHKYIKNNDGWTELTQ